MSRKKQVTVTLLLDTTSAPETIKGWLRQLADREHLNISEVTVTVDETGERAR